MANFNGIVSIGVVHFMANTLNEISSTAWWSCAAKPLDEFY